jgi:hypothetical protein
MLLHSVYRELGSLVSVTCKLLQTGSVSRHVPHVGTGRKPFRTVQMTRLPITFKMRCPVDSLPFGSVSD